MSDHLGDGVSRAALEALGIPPLSIDPFITPVAPKPNGKARGKTNGQGRTDRERPPAFLLAALQPGEKICRVRLVSGLIAWRRLVPVVDGYYLDADRRGLFKDPARGGDDDDDSEPGAKPKREQRHGFPMLLKCVAPRGKPGREDAAPSEVMCRIQWLWPNGDASEAQLWSAAAIRKGEYIDQLTIAAVPAARPRLIQLFAEIIFAQRRAFPVTFERPVRHSGFSAADEAPAYVLHDGRALLPGGKTDPGSIAGEPPLLQRKRRERWESQFQTLPSAQPSEDQLRATVDALLTFDRRGRALCAAMLGLRALFYSLRSMDVTVLLTGLRGTAKTSIGQIMHWAEGPCAAADEPDMSLRTTFLGSELMSDRQRDCAFLMDDGDRVRANDPGAPLKPEVVKLISDRTREAFDGAPSRIRGGKTLTLAEQRRTQQLLVFSAETALGLEASVLARQIWWTFEKGEIELEPMLSADWQETPTWTACQETVTACGHEVLRRVLDIWGSRDRAAAVNFIREIDLEASELAATAELGGEAEDRPRIQRGLAMIIAGGILFDIGAGTENMMRDLALEYGAGLAKAQLDRLASGATATVGFDFEWFRTAFEDWLGESLWLDAETGGPFKSHDPSAAGDLMNIGYRWRPGVGMATGGGEFVPSDKRPAGWRHNSAKKYLFDQAQFIAYCDRRVARHGGAFPFNRQTLPAHLVQTIGFAVPGNMGNRHKFRPPGSNLPYPVCVLCVPFQKLIDDENEAGTAGTAGTASATSCNAYENPVPAIDPLMFPLSESGNRSLSEAGTANNDINQYVADSVPAVPAVPAENEPFHAFCAQNGQAFENVKNEPEIGSAPANQPAERLSAAEIGQEQREQAKQGEQEQAALASQSLASASASPLAEAPIPPEPAPATSEAPRVALSASVDMDDRFIFSITPRLVAGPLQPHNFGLALRANTSGEPQTTTAAGILPAGLSLPLASALPTPLGPCCPWPRREDPSQARQKPASASFAAEAPIPPEPAPATSEAPRAASSTVAQVLADQAIQAKRLREALLAEPMPDTAIQKPSQASQKPASASPLAEAPIPPEPAPATSEARRPASEANRGRWKRFIRSKEPAHAPSPDLAPAIVTIGASAAFRVDRLGEVSPIEGPSPGASISDVLDWGEVNRFKQVVVMPDWCEATSMPGVHNLTHEGLPHPWATPEGGRWRVDNPGELHWSINGRRNGGSGRNPIELAFPGYDYRSPDMRGAQDAETQAYARAEFLMAMTSDNGRAGFHFHHGCAEFFHGVQRALAKDKGTAETAPDLSPANYPPAARRVAGEREVAGNIYWCRTLQPHEASFKHAISFDRNGAWLGAMTGRSHGVSGLHRASSPVAFDKEVPGWHRVKYEKPDWPDGLPYPGLLLPPGVAGWLETATVAFLEEVKATIVFEEAWLWREHARVLDRLQERFRDARSRLMQRKADQVLPAKRRAGAAIALSTVKDCIVQGIGWFDRTDDRDKTEIVPHHRPHWRHGIIARAGANLIRGAMQAGTRTGLYPIGINVDALVYLSAHPDAEALAAKLGLKLGTGLGHYKVAGVFPAAKFVRTLKRAKSDETRRKALKTLLEGEGQ